LEQFWKYKIESIELNSDYIFVTTGLIYFELGQWN